MIPALKNIYKSIYVAKTRREIFSNMYIICEWCAYVNIPWSQTKQHSNESFLRISPKINFHESAKPKFILHWRKYQVHSLLKAQLFV